MERFENKVAVVTGASAGIGAACVLDLVKSGMFVVALARREGPLNDLKLGLPEHLQFKMFPKKCDVTVEKEVSSVFKWTINHLGPVHVLVCSAGVLKLTQLSGTIDTYKIRDTVETNIMGVTYCVREAYQQMKAHNIDGHRSSL
uniref:Ketoreductase (KR) domain-containing protein n=1 Tax=Megaselia scalaris TaxID=36166 RepID=T1GAR0_MEGSC